jgi:hypothetical protein
MMRNTISFKNLHDVLTRLGFSKEERIAIYDNGFSNVSFGDAAYTLVGNNFALQCIIDGLDIDNQLSEDRITEIGNKYWEFVSEDEYINLEA